MVSSPVTDFWKPPGILYYCLAATGLAESFRIDIGNYPECFKAMTD